jgi:H+/Cl- antiporter ClcA
MSNNVTAGAGGYVMGMISLFIQQVQIQSMVEVFIYGVIGGIAGIVGKILAEWIAKKIRKALKIEPKQKKNGNKE